MAPNPAPKRKRPAFSPPRPNKSKSTITASESSKPAKPRGRPSASKEKPKQSRKSLVLSSTEEDDDNEEPDAASDSALSDTEISPEPDFILAEVSAETSTLSSSEPAIPTALLNRLLHHHFHDKEKTKITTDAQKVIAKYMETFVREAIMRCAYVGQTEQEDDGIRETKDGGWLEVEDLEKVAPQILLDF